jgi:DNA-binding Lrp family transcriptional regulator
MSEQHDVATAAGPVDDDAAIAGIVARLTGEYVLRGFSLVASGFGDIRAGFVGQTINTLNVAPVIHTDAGRRAAGDDGILPDEARRPVTVTRLAEETGLPFESARRVVQRLTDAGACVRVPGGVIVPKAFAMRPAPIDAIVANLGYMRRFVSDVETAGLVDAPVSLPTTRHAAAARGRATLSTEFGLRALRLLIDTYGDIQAGIVAQTIITANTAHLDTRKGEGRRYAGADEIPPDEIRRPISVSRLADSVGLPFETMRGQVNRLLEAGLCVRTDGGVIVPAAVLGRPSMVRAALLNTQYARQFVRELRAAGFDVNVTPVLPRPAPPREAV